MMLLPEWQEQSARIAASSCAVAFLMGIAHGQWLLARGEDLLPPAELLDFVATLVPADGHLSLYHLCNAEIEIKQWIAEHPSEETA